jgi:hypothetical protein
MRGLLMNTGVEESPGGGRMRRRRGASDAMWVQPAAFPHCPVSERVTADPVAVAFLDVRPSSQTGTGALLTIHPQDAVHLHVMRQVAYLTEQFRSD